MQEQLSKYFIFLFVILEFILSIFALFGLTLTLHKFNPVLVIILASLLILFSFIISVGAFISSLKTKSTFISNFHSLVALIFFILILVSSLSFFNFISVLSFSTQVLPNDNQAFITLNKFGHEDYLSPVKETVLEENRDDLYYAKVINYTIKHFECNYNILPPSYEYMLYNNEPIRLYTVKANTFKNIKEDYTEYKIGIRISDGKIVFYSA